MSVKIEDKQRVLSIIDIQERLEYLIHLMESEIDLLHVEKKIRGRVPCSHGGWPQSDAYRMRP